MTWYICGPTTYDHSHLGHARNYITFDIIRRILQDYFGYEVFSVMNITDVDDKIILKARKRYLLSNYKKEHTLLSNEVKEYVQAAWKSLLASMEKKIEKVEKDENKKPNEKKAEVQLHQEKLEQAKKELHEVEKLFKENKQENLERILKISSDALSDKLDAELGHTVVDNDIYRKLAAEYEEEYLEDMSDLNVLMPDVLTRVTEYIPEVIEYVKKIVENGFGYEANGSVYFDSQKFAQHKEHDYGKLEPWSIGLEGLLAEGEGALTNTIEGEKKLKTDFALWKKSKTGEPSWDSPWGKGRPGKNFSLCFKKKGYSKSRPNLKSKNWHQPKF